jgi:glycosyltransferase involved in cell wall biosynthesis
VLSQVDLLTVPSLWHETFSLVTHEAFAAGVPVIASRVGAMSEAVQDGVNGLLLPPGDVNAWQVALQRLVNEPGLIEGLRTNVHPPLTLDAHVQRLESLLRS